MSCERQEYVLADKLRSQFRGRGQDVSGMRATSTPELMRRAEMGHDPRENCSEQAFRENYSRRQSGQNHSYSYDSAGGRYNEEPRAAKSSGSASQKSSRARSQTASRAQNQGNGTSKAKKSRESSGGYVRLMPDDEIKVRHRMLSPVFFLLLAVITVMVMFLVMEISDVYETANEISELEDRLDAMQSEADELELKLEEKNDIREIERIATDELGMAKEDTLQRRYISISDGERIELIDSGEDEEGAGGVLLSSVLSAISDLFG